MHKYVLILSLVVLVITGGLVLAQDDPQEGDPTTNWCYDPDIWGDGRCDDPDPWIRDWFWGCGWYGAHYDNGVYTSVPDWCASEDAFIEQIKPTDEPTEEVTPDATEEPTTQPTDEDNPCPPNFMYLEDYDICFPIGWGVD